MAERAKGEDREVAPGGRQGPGPRPHSPARPQVPLSGPALQGGPGHNKRQLLGPACGPCVLVWVLWLPGRGKRWGPHPFAFGSSVPAVTLRTKSDRVGECPHPRQPLTTPHTQHARSPWGPGFLERQENPEIGQNTKGSHRTTASWGGVQWERNGPCGSQVLDRP